MGVLPPFLQDGKLHNICLVLEGYEEYYYFNRILYLIFDYPHKHYTFKYFEV